MDDERLEQDLVEDSDTEGELGELEGEAWEHYDAEERAGSGLGGKAGCIEAAILCVQANAESVSRYLRGNAQDLLGLAEEWQEGLDAGEEASMFDDVMNALEDMLESAQYFAKRKGWGAKTIRSRAESDVLAITRVLVMFERERD